MGMVSMYTRTWCHIGHHAQAYKPHITWQQIDCSMNPKTAPVLALRGIWRPKFGLAEALVLSGTSTQQPTGTRPSRTRLRRSARLETVRWCDGSPTSFEIGRLLRRPPDVTLCLPGALPPAEQSTPYRLVQQHAASTQSSELLVSREGTGHWAPRTRWGRAPSSEPRLPLPTAHRRKPTAAESSMPAVKMPTMTSALF